MQRGRGRRRVRGWKHSPFAATAAAAAPAFCALILLACNLGHFLADDGDKQVADVAITVDGSVAVIRALAHDSDDWHQAAVTACHEHRINSHSCSSSVVRAFGELYTAGRSNTIGTVHLRISASDGSRQVLPVLPPLETVAVDLALDIFGEPLLMPAEVLLCHEFVTIALAGPEDVAAAFCRPLASEVQLLERHGLWTRLDLQLDPRTKVVRADAARQSRKGELNHRFRLSAHLRCWLQLSGRELAGSSSTIRLVNLSVFDNLYDSEQALLDATWLSLQRLREHQESSSDDLGTFYLLGSQLARLPDRSLAGAHWEEGVRRGWIDHPGRHPFRQWAPHLDGPNLRPFWSAKQIDRAAVEIGGGQELVRLQVEEQEKEGMFLDSLIVTHSPSPPPCRRPNGNSVLGCSAVAAAKILEDPANWQRIRDEAEDLWSRRECFSVDGENLAGEGDWHVCTIFQADKPAYFRNDGVGREQGTITGEIVRSAWPEPCRSVYGGRTMLSLLRGRTHVWPHSGPSNLRIRTLLPLKVPDGTYRMRVGDEGAARHLREGEMIIFDDTFEHEAWAIPDVQDNETQSGKGFAPTDRLILIIDTWMPSIVERDRVNGIIMGQAHHCASHKLHSERESCADAAGNALFPQNQGSGRAFLSQRHSQSDRVHLKFDVAEAQAYESKLESKLLALIKEKEDTAVKVPAFKISYPQTGAIIRVPPYDNFSLTFENHGTRQLPISSHCIEIDKDGQCYRLLELSLRGVRVVPGTHVFELKNSVSWEVVHSITVDFRERQGCTGGFETKRGLTAPLPETASISSRFPRFKRLLARRGRPLEIGLLGLSWELGGSQLALVEQAKHLQKRYPALFRFTYLSPPVDRMDESHSDGLKALLEAEGIAHAPFVLSWRFVMNSTFWSSLRERSSEDGLDSLLSPSLQQLSKFDTVSTINTGHPSALGLLDLASLAGVPVRVLELPNIESTVRSETAQGIVAPSNFVLQHPRLVFDRAQTEALVIPPMPVAVVDSGDRGSGSDVKRNEVVIGYVTRMSFERSPGLFLHVAAELLRSMEADLAADNDETKVSLRFVMVGGGFLLEPMIELARSLGISHVVEFRGSVKRESVLRELAGMDIYFSSRLGETFGMALVEAASRGLPIVGCACGAYSEIVVNGTSGLLVPCHDDEKAKGDGIVLALTRALRHLVLDSSVRRALGAAARHRAHSYFGVDRFVELYSSFYGALWLKHGKE